MAAPKGHKRYGGRVKGQPNAATANARAAIALFVDSNAHRLQSWLDTIAEGVYVDKEDGTKEMVTPPNPVKAYELFQSVIEYHVPKLGRVEMTGPDGKTLEISIVRYSNPK